MQQDLVPPSEGDRGGVYTEPRKAFCSQTRKVDHATKFVPPEGDRGGDYTDPRKAFCSQTRKVDHATRIGSPFGGGLRGRKMIKIISININPINHSHKLITFVSLANKRCEKIRFLRFDSIQKHTIT